MTQQLIAVDAGALSDLIDRLTKIEKMLASAELSRREDWLSIPEAARILKCDPSTIRRKINSGELKASGSGKTRRVQLS